MSSLIPEGFEWCLDCAARDGQYHQDGCDVARCKACGRQELSCVHDAEVVGRTVWHGYWPGDVEIKEGLATDLLDLAVRAAKGDLYWDVSKERFFLNWKHAEQPVD